MGFGRWSQKIHYWPNVDPALFPHYIRRRRDGIELPTATSERVFSSDEHHAGLRSVHHGHAAWQTHVHQSLHGGSIDFGIYLYDMMRIKSWHFAVRTHRELVPRSVLALQASNQDPSLLDQISKNVTRQGITPATLDYLRLCVILEPMQELMSRHKAYALSPRDCLKTTLFQKWQRMVAPPANNKMNAETQRPPNKRCKRKGSQTGGSAGINQAQPAAPNKKRSPGPNFSLASQDVMVVGEPSLMGGEFGDEDERLITRLENTQYDPAVSLDDPTGGGGGSGGGGPPPPGPPPQFNSGPSGPPGPNDPSPWGDVPKSGGGNKGGGGDAGKKAQPLASDISFHKAFNLFQANLFISLSENKKIEDFVS